MAVGNLKTRGLFILNGVLEYWSVGVMRVLDLRLQI